MKKKLFVESFDPFIWGKTTWLMTCFYAKEKYKIKRLKMFPKLLINEITGIC